MRMVWALGLAWGGAAAMAAGALGTEPTQIGVASVEITPEMPIRLSGYGSRDTEATEIEDPLYAKALAIKAGDAPLSVLITVELLGVPEWLTRELADRLHDRLGLEPSRLAVLATHTHNGPVVRGVAPTLFGGPLPQEQHERVDRYSDGLVERLEQAALEAMDDRRPGSLAWGRGEVEFAVNRRRLDEDDQWVGFGEVPDGPVDHELPVLAALDPDGNPRAVLASYACHCTTLTGEHNFVHGDWAGEAASRLEEAFEGTTAMIAIGCGADANPQPRGSLEDARSHGEAIAEEVGSVIEEGLEPLRSGPQGEIRQVELPFEPLTRTDLADRADDPVYGYSATKLLEDLGPDEQVPSHLPYTIQTWQFGDELAMIFLPGEVVVDYARRLKGELAGPRLWVNAYANAAPCYVASRRLLDEGGYEVDRSMAYYQQPNRLHPEAEDVILDTVHEMLDPAYNRQWEDDSPRELFGDNEPRPIEPEDDGTLRLVAAAGTPYGRRIEYMPEPEWEAFGWWRAGDYAAWEVRIEEGGQYDVYKEWAVSDSSARRPYLLELGEKRLRGYVGRTGGWDRFRRSRIGRVTLEPGRIQVAFKPASRFETGALLDLRELRLVPVD